MENEYVLVQGGLLKTVTLMEWQTHLTESLSLSQRPTAEASLYVAKDVTD